MHTQGGYCQAPAEALSERKLRGHNGNGRRGRVEAAVASRPGGGPACLPACRCSEWAAEPPSSARGGPDTAQHAQEKKGAPPASVQMTHNLARLPAAAGSAATLKVFVSLGGHGPVLCVPRCPKAKDQPFVGLACGGVRCFLEASQSQCEHLYCGRPADDAVSRSSAAQ